MKYALSWYIILKTMERPSNFVELSRMMKISVNEEETALFLVNVGFLHLHIELRCAFCDSIEFSLYCTCGCHGQVVSETISVLLHFNAKLI